MLTLIRSDAPSEGTAPRSKRLPETGDPVSAWLARQFATEGSASAAGYVVARRTSHTRHLHNSVVRRVGR